MMAFGILAHFDHSFNSRCERKTFYMEVMFELPNAEGSLLIMLLASAAWLVRFLLCVESKIPNDDANIFANDIFYAEKFQLPSHLSSGTNVASREEYD